MRVIHVVPFAARLGGYENQARLLMQAHAAHGIPTLLITHDSHATPGPDAGWPSETTVLSFKPRRGRFATSRIAAALRQHLARDERAVLHVHALDVLAGAAVDAAWNELGLPALVSVASPGDVTAFVHTAPALRDVDVDSTMEGSILHAWLQRSAMREAWQRLSRADVWIALSREIAEELENVGQIPLGRIHDCPNAVVVPEDPLPLRPDGTDAILIGRLVEGKGVFTAAEALLRVRQSFPHATLTLVGDGPARQALQEMAAQPEYGGSLRIAGRREGGVFEEFRPDLFVFPTVREGCPNALLEACAHGVPCLTSRVGGIADWFDVHSDLRTVDDPRDVERLAGEWIDLLGDADARQALADRGRARVLGVASVERVFERHLGLYEAILDPTIG